MSSAELTEWIAFSRIEPFGCLVDDYRAGLYPAIRMNQGKKAGDEFTSPAAFFPWNEYKEPEAPKSRRDLSAGVLDFFKSITQGKGKSKHGR